MKNKDIDFKIIKFEELTWKHIERLDRNKTIFFLPISPMEEHGPHLPIGTDYLIIKDAATEAIKFLNKKRPDLKFILLPKSVSINFLKQVYTDASVSFLAMPPANPKTSANSERRRDLSNLT